MKETETKRFGLNQSEINDEFVNEILEDNGIEINLTKKRKKLLAILLYINGIDKKNENGYFFVENSFLCEIVGIAENNLINGLNYLKKIKLIDRISGKRGSASLYKVNISDNPKNVSDNPKNVSDKLENVSDNPKNVSNKLENVSDNPKNVSNKLENVSDNPKNVSNNVSDNPKNVSNNVSNNPKNVSNNPKNVSDNVSNNPKNVSDNVSDKLENVSDKLENVSTDIELDKDIEKDIEKDKELDKEKYINKNIINNIYIEILKMRSIYENELSKIGESFSELSNKIQNLTNEIENLKQELKKEKSKTISNLYKIESLQKEIEKDTIPMKVEKKEEVKQKQNKDIPSEVEKEEVSQTLYKLAGKNYLKQGHEWETPLDELDEILNTPIEEEKETLPNQNRSEKETFEKELDLPIEGESRRSAGNASGILSNTDDGMVAHQVIEKALKAQETPYFAEYTNINEVDLNLLYEKYDTATLLDKFYIDFSNNTIKSKTQREVRGSYDFILQEDTEFKNMVNNLNCWDEATIFQATAGNTSGIA